jgi:uncharacterized protein (TIGR00159 family)
MTTAFIDFHFLDVLDIILVAFIIYQVYYLIRGTVAIKIFIGILAIYLLWKLVTALQMEMLGEILGQFIGVGVIALLIVFQQELRQFLLFIGNQDLVGKKKWFRKLFPQRKSESDINIEAITHACSRMAESRTGALIVIANHSNPDNFIKSSQKLDADISSSLLQSIFFKNSPLHDGAVVIRNGKISSARGILPVSDNLETSDTLGMRHRAALGISELSDSYAIVVSEQTGSISVAQEGKLVNDLSDSDLKQHLENRKHHD